MRRLDLVLALAIVACSSKAVPPAVDASELDGAADGRGDASADASLDAAPSPGDAGRDAARAALVDSLGPMALTPTVKCSGIGGKHVADMDLRASFVDGNDLLAIMNRSPMGALPSAYAPSDLVDIRNGKPATAWECDKLACLRKDAYTALGELLAAMKERGFPGRVESAYRSYTMQCGTFLTWAKKGSFCEATEQSALAGHSQHQLGTTVDIFSDEWARDGRGVFREGFGCTPAGTFLKEHAWDYGFVMPYPIHPDDRHPKQKCVTRWDIPIGINPKTGYRYETWHARYIGKDAALRFKAAWEASSPGSPDELALEQWLRAEKGASSRADADIPVCDGCNCGACSTLSAPGDDFCDKHGGALHLDDRGRPLAGRTTPRIAAASRGSLKKWHGTVLDIEVDDADGAVTQTPILGPTAASYEKGATFEKLAPYPDTQARAFPALDGAWVVGIEPVPNDTGSAWPWRAALTTSVIGQVYDRANVLLPASSGPMKIPLPEGVHKVRVVLLQGGVPKGDPRQVDLQ